ncbi:MAG: AgmX/PglI C-terminal domain-containing protein [Deltaproteobacteria bacterium]|nr:AgmX/PglI C-terminal domain-containing protein [Deltaproteobacteria bacterium]
MKAATTGAALRTDAQPRCGDKNGLTEEQVREVVVPRVKEISACHRKGLARNPAIPFEINIRWMIEADGGVSQSAVTSSGMGIKEFEECVKREVTGWRFPRAARRSDITFPFVFKDEASLLSAANQIYADLEELVVKTPSPRNSRVYRAIADTLAEIKKARIKVRVLMTLPPSVFEGVVFDVVRDKDREYGVISISPYVVDIHARRPSIVLSAIVHEMQHARSYAISPAGFKDKKNSLERYLYERDAYIIEAEFVRDYILKNSRYDPTPFERFLEASLREDGFRSFSIGMLGHDMEIARTLYLVSEKKVSHAEKLAEIEGTLERLLAKPILTKGSPWDLYLQMVPIYSALQFTPQSIRYVNAAHGKVAPGPWSVKGAHPKLWKRLLDLESKFAANRALYFDYLQAIQKKMSEF